MAVSGVLVSCSSRPKGGGTTASHCSGTLFAGHWVLTSATLLGAAVQAGPNYRSALRALDKALSGGALATDTAFLDSHRLEFTALLGTPRRRHRGALRGLEGGTVMYHSPGPVSATTDRPEVAASLSAAWLCPLVSGAVEGLLGDWTLGGAASEREDGGMEQDSEVVRTLLPVFLLLRLGAESGADDAVSALRSLYAQLGPRPHRGQDVLVEATPFSNPHFHNSVSRGVVSNSLDCLLLTDARTTHGCEGGPISVGRRLVALVACSLTWWRGEWVGFTLGVLLRPVLARLLHGTTPSGPPGEPAPRYTQAIDDAVVVVRCGRGWGSGVVVDSESGTVITCSHAVASANTSPVSVHWKGKTLDARLVFRTRDGVAFDVAVLDVGPNSGLSEVSFDKDSPDKGDPVVAAGFPLFSERDLPYLLPTLTRGVVSHVAGGGSAILHTTCCVQSGASGGAVLRPGDGLPLRLVALVACNIQEQGSGALFPHVNLAVPATVMAAPLAGYRATRDVKFLHALESKDPNVQRLWKLQPLASKL